MDDYLRPTHLPRCETPMGLLGHHGLADSFEVTENLVAFTLRRYIRQLRRLKASATTPPGSLSAQGARICESPIFGQAQSLSGFQRAPLSGNGRQEVTSR